MRTYLPEAYWATGKEKAEWGEMGVTTVEHTLFILPPMETRGQEYWCFYFDDPSGYFGLYDSRQHVCAAILKYFETAVAREKNHKKMPERRQQKYALPDVDPQWTFRVTEDLGNSVIAILSLSQDCWAYESDDADDVARMLSKYLARKGGRAPQHKELKENPIPSVAPKERAAALAVVPKERAEPPLAESDEPTVAESPQRSAPAWDEITSELLRDVVSEREKAETQLKKWEQEVERLTGLIGAIEFTRDALFRKYGRQQRSEIA